MNLCQFLLPPGFASTVHTTNTIIENTLESPPALERALSESLLERAALREE